MKKFLLSLILVSPFLSLNTYADSAASWNCRGKTVELKSITPYMGENSPFSQTLYVITRIETKSEYVNTAFFLDINFDIGKSGTIHLSGKNEVKGHFNLLMSAPVDISDGTIIRMKSEGILTYSQGPSLRGKEKVECRFE